MDEIGIRRCEISCNHLTQLTKLNHMNETKCKVDAGSIERVKSLNHIRTIKIKDELSRSHNPATVKSAH